MRREILAVGLAGLLSAVAWARPGAAACTNDVDCPTATCGGQVCKWATSGHACVAAGTDPQGTDGWCTVDTDCKCKAEGATCVGTYCTFTLPRDGGASTAEGGGGSSSSGGGGGSGGPATIPDSSVTSGTTTPGGSGGCALGGSGSAPGGAALALACALALVRRRRG
jgi:hypothetical protein